LGGADNFSMSFGYEPGASEGPRVEAGDEVWSRPASAVEAAPPASTEVVSPASLPPEPPAQDSANHPPVPPDVAPERAPPPPLRFRHHLLVLAFALIGGLLGILGAVAEELQAGLLSFVLAGVIEESLKPAGIYIVLLKWPWALRGRLYTAAFTALSGLVFGVIEACVYVFVYFPDKGGDFVLYRFTVPLVLHTGCSFLFGLGIVPQLIDWANGLAKFPRVSRNFFIAAMTIHGGFNLTAVILELAGVISVG
jgi:hypothetical protein